jgi:hypothetical protein
MCVALCVCRSPIFLLEMPGRAGRQANKQASKQTSKQANKQASKQAACSGRDGGRARTHCCKYKQQAAAVTSGSSSSPAMHECRWGLIVSQPVGRGCESTDLSGRSFIKTYVNLATIVNSSIRLSLSTGAQRDPLPRNTTSRRVAVGMRNSKIWIAHASQGVRGFFFFFFVFFSPSCRPPPAHTSLVGLQSSIISSPSNGVVGRASWSRRRGHGPSPTRQALVIDYLFLRNTEHSAREARVGDGSISAHRGAFSLTGS